MVLNRMQDRATMNVLTLGCVNQHATFVSHSTQHKAEQSATTSCTFSSAYIYIYIPIHMYFGHVCRYAYACFLYVYLTITITRRRCKDAQTTSLHLCTLSIARPITMTKNLQSLHERRCKCPSPVHECHKG